MKKKILALSLTACLLISALAGCSKSEAPKETTAAGGGAATGTTYDLNVCLASEPDSLDPALSTSTDGAMTIQHMREGLMKWADGGDGVGTIVYGQAESYEVNDDKTVYTFHLRDNIKWSDGKDVTAEDFVYSWQRLVDPDTAADYNYMIDMVVNANEIMAGEMDKSELGMKAIDSKTLEITLNYACPYFLDVCGFAATYPVRQDIIETYGDQWTFDPATYISNGSYTLKEWVHNSYILAVKNENYYDAESIGPDSIKFSLMDDNNAMLAAFNSGELSFIRDMPVDEVPTLLANGTLHVVDYIGTYYVCFQNQKAPFDNPLVRKAFSLVIDRNYVIEQITRTGEAAATGYVPAGINDAQGANGDDFRTIGGDYYSVAKADYQANCEEARALLAEAGYPDGKGFPVVEYLYNTNDRHKVIGEALQDMWQTELGVSVTLNNQDWNVFLDNRKAGNYSIARNGWIADYNDPISFIDMWVTGGGNNDAQYANPAYDALVAEAKGTSVPEDRMKAMHAAEDILMGESVLAPIYFYTEKYMMDDSIDGMFYCPLGYFFFMNTTKK